MRPGASDSEGDDLTDWARHSTFVAVYATTRIAKSNIPDVHMTSGPPRIDGQKVPLTQTSPYYPSKTGPPSLDCATARADGGD